MTDIDRKTAELKGWRERGPYLWINGITGEHKEGDGARLFNWSTSDAKAFDLVDEVSQKTPERTGRWYLRMQEEYASPGLDFMPWDAMFLYCVGPEIKHKVRERGKTRAEAICRAYIALKEWEGKR